MLGIDDDYVAYCLDEAVTHLCQTIQGEIDKATEKAKTEKAARARGQAILDSWLKPGGKKKQFADPAAFSKPIKKKEEVIQ